MNKTEELKRRMQEKEKMEDKYWDDNILEDNEVLKDDMETLEDFIIRAIENDDMETKAYSNKYNGGQVYLRYKQKSKDNLLKHIPTGFKEIDDITNNGLRPGQMYIISGEPGSGKSTFCIQMMYQILKQKHNVIYVTTELEEEVVLCKLLNLVFVLDRGLDVSDPRNSDKLFILNELLNDEFRSKEREIEVNRILKDYFKEFMYNFFIVKTDNTEEIEKVVEEVEKPILIIDYIQELYPKATYQTDKQKIDEVLKELAKLKDHYKIPIVIVSSLNRAGYGNENSQSSLKESGNLEYKAAGIIRIKRGENNRMKINYIKNRFGTHCSFFEAVFYPEYGLFKEFIKKKG